MDFLPLLLRVLHSIERASRPCRPVSRLRKKPWIRKRPEASETPEAATPKQATPKQANPQQASPNEPSLNPSANADEATADAMRRVTKPTPEWLLAGSRPLASRTESRYGCNGSGRLLASRHPTPVATATAGVIAALPGLGVERQRIGQALGNKTGDCKG